MEDAKVWAARELSAGSANLKEAVERYAKKESAELRKMLIDRPDGYFPDRVYKAIDIALINRGEDIATGYSRELNRNSKPAKMPGQANGIKSPNIFSLLGLSGFIFGFTMIFLFTGRFGGALYAIPAFFIGTVFVVAPIEAWTTNPLNRRIAAYIVFLVSGLIIGARVMLSAPK